MFFRTVYGIGDEGVLLNGAERMLREVHSTLTSLNFCRPAVSSSPRHGSANRNFDWVGAVAGDLHHRRDRLLHLSLLLAGIQERAALRPSHDGVGSGVAGGLDAGQPSLVYNTVFDDSRLGRPRQRPACAALAAVAADRGRSGWHGGDVTPHRGALAALAAMTTFLNRGGRRGVDHLCVRVRIAPAGMLAYVVGHHALAAAFDDVIVLTATRYAAIQSVPFGFGGRILPSSTCSRSRPC